MANEAIVRLRELTGAGMMDCKKALGETSGDIEAAVDWLRAKGLSKAAKKAERAAARREPDVADARGIEAPFGGMGETLDPLDQDAPVPGAVEHGHPALVVPLVG